MWSELVPRPFFQLLATLVFKRLKCIICLSVWMIALLPNGYVQSGLSDTTRTHEKIDPRYRIGAYYFGYWGPHFPADQLKHYQEKFRKSPDWWAGVRDLHDATPLAQGLFPGDFAHLKPEIGYYNLANPQVVERHIQQALEYGLSFFNFYFFWDGEAGREKYADGLESYLLAQNRKEIGFLLSIVADQANPIPREAFAKVVAHISEHYLAEANYLKMEGGRPVVELLLNQGIGDGSSEDSDLFLGQLRSDVLTRLGVDPFIIVSSSAGHFEKIRGVNGYTCTDHYWYPEGLKSPVKPYESYIDSIGPFFDLMKKKVGEENFFYCVSSGHDERPRIYLNPQANSDVDVERVRRALPYYSDRSPLLFASALRRVKTRMDSGVSHSAEYLMVYAWNEWNEGGVIEPDAKDGAVYLSTIAKVFSSHE
jgi:hypothetical protein